MIQVVGGRGRGHFLPKPVIWAVLGLFSPSFSPTTVAPEGHKKVIKRAKSAAAAAEFPVKTNEKTDTQAMLLLPRWSQSSNRMLATTSEPSPRGLGTALCDFEGLSRAPKEEGQVGVQCNP